MDENTSVVLPEHSNLAKKRNWRCIVIAIIIAVIGVYALNFFALQYDMNQTIKNDPRNQGISVLTHYDYYLDQGTLIYDLRAIDGKHSMADVFRVFLQFAERAKDKGFNKVILAYSGKEKFYINGEYYQKLGTEYSFQNPIYTIRTFPENLYNVDGSKAFPKWTGGLIGVLKQQMEDVNAFNHRWYLDEMKNQQ